MYSAHISIRYGKACHRTNCSLLFHGKMEKICTGRRKASEISRGQRRKDGMAQASRTRGTHGNRTGKNQRGEAADQLELRSVRQPWPCLLLERRAACAQPARSLLEFGSPPAPSRPQIRVHNRPASVGSGGAFSPVIPPPRRRRRRRDFQAGQGAPLPSRVSLG